MNTRIKRWLPIALCCLPGVVVAGIVGVGIAAGGVGFGAAAGGSLGLGLIVLAALACPLSMGLIMLRRPRQTAASGNSTVGADCCAPGEAPAASEPSSPADRLAALRAQREALERELAQLQTH